MAVVGPDHLSFTWFAVASSESTALARPASDFVRRNAQLSKLGIVTTVTVQVSTQAQYRFGHMSQ